MNNRKLFTTCLLLFSLVLFSQKKQLIQGEVFDEYLVPFYGARVTTSSGKVVTTNSDGIFNLKTKLPAELIVYADGYTQETIRVESADQEISLILKEQNTFDQVVVSASRTSERIFESPVTIERLGISDIKRGTAFNFYEELGNLRDVNVTNNSFSIKSVNTRGFSTLRNVRYVQLIDGVDNIYPGSAISYGNISGIVDLDVASAEVLPGAASALYGANAFNGLLLINSKNPFDYTGISAEFKTGMLSQKGVDDSAFFHPSVRMAYKFSDKFAAKVTFSLQSGSDWQAIDYRDGFGGRLNKNVTGHNQSTFYDGVNIYGDRTFNMKVIGYTSYLNPDIPLTNEDLKKLPVQNITRTGYRESNFTDSQYDSKKLNLAFHYRPFGNEDLQLIWSSRFNSSDYILQAPPSRYDQKSDYYSSHMLEVKGNNFYVRGYYNTIDGGDSHNLRVLGENVEDYISDEEWLTRYITEYLSNGQNHELSRQAADKGRPKPGTKLFNNLIANSKSKLLSEGGSKLIDQTSFYNIDFNYNFKDQIKFAEIQVGASFREYLLGGENEEGVGSLFTDYNGAVVHDEYGVYTQAQKKLFDDRFKILGSIRFDKSKNIEGSFSPRISLTYALGADKNHNFRASYQSAFRNPSMQEQHFGLKVANNAYLLGNTSENIRRFKERTGIDPTANGVTASSLNAFINAVFTGVSDNAGSNEIAQNVGQSNYQDNLKVANFKNTKLKPEIVNTFELGYRGMISVESKMIEFDINAYHNHYENFIKEETLLIPDAGDITGERLTGTLDPSQIASNPYALALLSLTSGRSKAIIMPVNTDSKINSYGFGVSAKTKILSNFDVGVNYSYSDYDVLSDKEIAGFEPSFNTPKHSLKAFIGNDKLTKNLGFMVNARWNSRYLWQSPFVDATVDANTFIDAQISYSIPSMKSRFKLVANNLFGQDYSKVIGTGAVGKTYFLSWTIND